jgi:hypothetical protein
MVKRLGTQNRALAKQDPWTEQTTLTGQTSLRISLHVLIGLREMT